MSAANTLKRPSPREGPETLEVDDDTYDKSHFPEYVQVGGKTFHRDAIPDDVAQLIDMLGDVRPAPDQSHPDQNNAHSSADPNTATNKPTDDADLSPSDTSSSDDSSDSESESVNSDTSKGKIYTAVPAQVDQAEQSDQTSAPKALESSDDDVDDDDDTSLIDPYEQAKMLMAEDKDDDDQDRPSKGPRQPPVIVNKPQVDMTPDEPIQPLGDVTSIVENYLVIHAVLTSSGKILDRDTVLCTSDRKIIGAVEDLVGRVEDPYYAVLFNSEKEIRDEGIEVGMTIHFVERYAKFAMMQPLWETKGLDVGGELGVEEDDEIYFSDDEKEAAYRSQLRGQKDRPNGASSNRGRAGSARGARGDRPGRGGRGRGSSNFRGARQPRHQAPSRSEHGQPSYPSQPIDYGDDSSYVKLERPGTTSSSNDFSPMSAQHQHEAFSFRNSAGGRGRGRGDNSRGGAYSQPPRNLQYPTAPQSNANTYPPPFTQAPIQNYGTSFPSQYGYAPAPNYNVPSGSYINPSMMAAHTQGGQALQFPIPPPPPPPPPAQGPGQMPAFFPPPPPGFNFPPNFSQEMAQNLAQYFAQNGAHYQNNGGPGQQR